jgi:hypothetical protein
VPQAECAALLTFYESIGGRGWKDGRRWLQINNVCNWHSVVCNNGHLTAISLNSNKLAGHLPAALAEPPELHRLRLYFNYLEGAIPPNWPKLPLGSG